MKGTTLVDLYRAASNAILHLNIYVYIYMNEYYSMTHNMNEYSIVLYILFHL